MKQSAAIWTRDQKSWEIDQIIHYQLNPTLPALPGVNKWIDVFCKEVRGRELDEANRVSTRKKHPSGGWEGLILAFIVCVSSVNGGMAPGEMEIIFATEYGFRMCSPFRLGSRGERRPRQKFSQPNSEDQSTTNNGTACLKSDWVEVPWTWKRPHAIRRKILSTFAIF